MKAWPKEAVKWFILTPPPTVSNLLKVHSILIKVYIPWYNYRYVTSNKWPRVRSFYRYVVPKHNSLFLDILGSDHGEEQQTAHLHRNPPELHSIIILELLISQIPNSFYTFEGFLVSGRTNSSSSLGHHWSFLEEDDQSNGREKNHFLSPAWIYPLKEIPPKNHRDSKTHPIH